MTERETSAAKPPRKVMFYLGVDIAGADREEEMEFPAETTDEEIEAELKQWAWNFIDMSFWDIAEGGN